MSLTINCGILDDHYIYYFHFYEEDKMFLFPNYFVFPYRLNITSKSETICLYFVAMYGKMLVLVMIAFCLIEVMDNNVKPLTFQVKKVTI